MEKRINKLIESYLTSFKDEIRTKLMEINFNDNEKNNALLEYIYDYDRLVIKKEDLIKRKRVKNTIPSNNRCIAKRANGEQCTRRKMVECEFCGTHIKGTPQGIIQKNGTMETTNVKLEVVTEDIKGIVYYIDKYNNVYKTEDIISNKMNPQIIATCVKQNGVYTIPEFGLV